MPTLLDRPPDHVVEMLEVIGRGYELAGGWPCWQWVKHRLWLKDLDAEEILQDLPTWSHGYRSVRAGANGQWPDNGDPVALSVHGMAPLVLPGVQTLVSGFLAAIEVAIVMQRRIMPSPAKPVELEVPGGDFIREVNGRAGTVLMAGQLFGVLRGEPATWRGVDNSAGRESWDLTDVRLSRYAGIKDARDYLGRLEEMVGVPRVMAHAQPLGPMALPEALDHLDLAWRLLAGEHLVRVPRAAMAAKLSQPVASAEEFESRCSAMADIVDAHLEFPSPAR